MLLKGFTGRGRACARLRVARARVSQELAELTERMNELRQRTKSVEMGMWVLLPYRRHAADGSVEDFQLRWRLRSNVYTNWDDLAPEIAKLPKGMRVWYEEANFLAEMLNGLWRITRDQGHLIDRLIAQQASDGERP